MAPEHAMSISFWAEVKSQHSSECNKDNSHRMTEWWIELSQNFFHICID